MELDSVTRLRLDLWTKALLDQSSDAKHVETVSMAALAFSVTTGSGTIALFAARWVGDVEQKKMLSSILLLLGLFLLGSGHIARRRLAICAERVYRYRREISTIIGCKEEEIPDTFAFVVRKNRKGKYKVENLFADVALVIGIYLSAFSYLALNVFMSQEMR